ncbi:MAG: hypothetical protein J5858_01470, partial [Lentisphaeria bacterium]|nr:hypothetical protein [Lentisphaeria bacterium]
FAVIELSAYHSIVEECGPPPETLKIILFTAEREGADEEDGHRIFHLENYEPSSGAAYAEFRHASRRVRLPGPGKHQAVNALAIYAALLELGINPESALTGLEKFHGVWRRFDPAGINRNGVRFFDDYAHNVEKIISCLKAGRELSAGKIIAFFQPHGYGPLGFMREELFQALEAELQEDDRFILLPVYYAGGTSSFKPQSSEVAADWKSRGKRHYQYLASRRDAPELIRSEARKGDIVLIMGARDNSLSDWAVELAGEHDNRKGNE